MRRCRWLLARLLYRLARWVGGPTWGTPVTLEEIRRQIAFATRAPWYSMSVNSVETTVKVAKRTWLRGDEEGESCPVKK